MTKTFLFNDTSLQKYSTSRTFFRQTLCSDCNVENVKILIVEFPWRGVHGSNNASRGHYTAIALLIGMQIGFRGLSRVFPCRLSSRVRYLRLLTKNNMEFNAFATATTQPVAF